MQVRLSKNAFENWLRPTSLVAFANDVATIAAPNTFGASTLESRYASEIQRVISDIVGRPVAVEFTVGTAPRTESGPPAGTNEQPARRNPNGTVKPARKQIDTTIGRVSIPSSETSQQLELASTPMPGLNPRYVYESYVVGKSNMFAHAASLAVAENPGEQYNPLYIYGGVGLGKTHLLHAIGHRALEIRPDLKICYVSSEKFTNDLIEALRNQRMKDFRARYRTIDLLMIDDIQFIGGKDSTQEEFFHTFNTLHQSGRQLVISSDRPPHAIAGLEDRLRSRFEGGLTADVQPPDFEMRMAILRTKAEELGARVPDDAVEYIAQRDKTNTRELEGALNRVIAYSRVGNRSISLPLAMEALSIGKTGTRRDDLTPDEIIRAVASYFGVAAEAMGGRSRSREIVVPRQIAMYMIREETSASLADIGRALGGRDHTTVMHGIEKIESQLQEDSGLRSQLLSIREALQTSR
ncbi:MAG: chromosomal replication initiator protein DnaA [Thermomicrobiales bacterium]|nr:chromosomal replication initiator protein DnaA [Thermomicrobiales bacterium]